MYCIVKRTDQWRLYDMDTRAHRRLEIEEAGKIARRYPSIVDPKVRGLILSAPRMKRMNVTSAMPAMPPTDLLLI